MIANDIPAVRRVAYPGHGERPGGNFVLLLCDEIEQLRAASAALARSLAAARAAAGDLLTFFPPEHKARLGAIALLTEGGA